MWMVVQYTLCGILAAGDASTPDNVYSAVRKAGHRVSYAAVLMALDTLEKQKRVRSSMRRVATCLGPIDRKVYDVTESGHAALAEQRRRFILA